MKRTRSNSDSGWLALVFCMLAACSTDGGGGTTGSPTSSNVFDSGDPSSGNSGGGTDPINGTGQGPTTQSIAIIGLDRNNDTRFAESATVVDATMIEGSRLAGNVRYAATTSQDSEIDLTTGASALIKDIDLTNSFRFGNADMIGVAGIPATNVPLTGTATYNGAADVLVNDGSGSPKNLSIAIAVANFDQNRIDVEINDGGPFWVKIDRANINGNTFQNGQFTASSSFATNPVTDGSLIHQGRFFGETANEVGGVLLLDRTAGDIEFRAQGVYSGKSGS